MTAYFEHHLYFLARNRAAHRDARNRAVHLVATITGFCSIVAMLARLQVPGQPALNAGLLFAVATVAYYAPFEPLATAIVAAACVCAVALFGPDFGQSHTSAWIGLGVPLLTFLVPNLTGVWTHRLFGDPILDPKAVDPVWKRLLKTVHTILFSSVQFVTFALLDLGYRPALHAQLCDRVARA